MRESWFSQDVFMCSVFIIQKKKKSEKRQEGRKELQEGTKRQTMKIEKQEREERKEKENQEIVDK
jgi:hypothetical protein